jgi:uncharacterized protein (TIGR02757 family)
MIWNQLTPEELKGFLDEKVNQFNHPSFIQSDPISIPHRYTRKEDVEIAAFFAATLAWGNRKAIIKSALDIMNRMDQAPYEFITQARSNDLNKLRSFVHRTFNGDDLVQFAKSLQHVYQLEGGMEGLFSRGFEVDACEAIRLFRSSFFKMKHTPRTTKHVSDPSTGSAAKRLHMFLRWMVRRDRRGVDFGLWQNISPSQLSIPLDVHSGNIARQLGMLHRKQNDAKAVVELDTQLRLLDSEDPVKYDFALFGLGVSGFFDE